MRRHYIGYVWIEKGQKASWKTAIEVIKVFKRGRSKGKLLVMLINNKSMKIKPEKLRLLKNCPDCHNELKKEEYVLKCEKCGWPGNGETNSDIPDGVQMPILQTQDGSFK
jgi:hypothetical protein